MLTQKLCQISDIFPHLMNIAQFAVILSSNDVEVQIKPRCVKRAIQSRLYST